MSRKKKARIGVGRPKEGRPPFAPEDRTITKNVRVRPEVYDYIKAKAQLAGVTMGDFIAAELAKAVKAEEAILDTKAEEMFGETNE